MHLAIHCLISEWAVEIRGLALGLFRHLYVNWLHPLLSGNNNNSKNLKSDKCFSIQGGFIFIFVFLLFWRLGFYFGGLRFRFFRTWRQEIEFWGFARWHTLVQEFTIVAVLDRGKNPNHILISRVSSMVVATQVHLFAVGIPHTHTSESRKPVVGIEKNAFFGLGLGIDPVFNARFGTGASIHSNTEGGPQDLLWSSAKRLWESI